MAITATLVAIGHDRLRYFVEAASSRGAIVSEGLTITTRGDAGPDLLRDTVRGPLKQVARAALDGYGRLSAGPKTQAQARALWLYDASAAIVGGLPVAISRFELREAHGAVACAVDADVDGDGFPRLAITISAEARLVRAYLDVVSVR